MSKLKIINPKTNVIPETQPVIPAQAGIYLYWIPVFTGMTVGGAGNDDRWILVLNFEFCY